MLKHISAKLIILKFNKAENGKTVLSSFFIFINHSVRQIGPLSFNSRVVLIAREVCIEPS